jgi:hypothetical protein
MGLDVGTTGAIVAGTSVAGAAVGATAGAQAVNPRTSAVNSPTNIAIFLDILSLLYKFWVNRQTVVSIKPLCKYLRFY